MTFDASEARHSAAFFNPQRDFWWNDDYLRLLAARFGLRDVQSVLDVGSGVGHWGTLLLPLLSPDATLVGVERDPRWVTDAERRASELGVDHRCRYVQGVGEALPVEDESFDLVTCQTFLIHVADVAAAIGEMVRALRPGGLLLVAEPNNLAGQVVADSVTAGMSTQQLTERFEFSLICERGKIALGEGNSSVGDLLPGYCARAGLRDVQTFVNDTTFELVPPYASPAQTVLRDLIVEEARTDRWGGQTEAEAQRYFLAGGGSELDFATRWPQRLAEVHEAAQRLDEQTFDTAGGGLHYVVAGRRASAQALP